MTKRKGIHTAVLVLGLSVATWAMASAGSEGPALPPAIQQAIGAGATVAFLDAQGNPVWTSSLGLEPRGDLLAMATQVVVYDAQGNAVLTLTVTKGPNGDAMVATPSGTAVEAERLAKAALGSGQASEVTGSEGKEAVHDEAMGSGPASGQGKEHVEHAKDGSQDRGRVDHSGSQDHSSSDQGSVDHSGSRGGSQDHGSVDPSGSQDHDSGDQGGDDHGEGQDD